MHSINFKLEHINHMHHKFWIKYMKENNKNPEHKSSDNIIKWGNRIHWIKITLVVRANGLDVCTYTVEQYIHCLMGNEFENNWEDRGIIGCFYNL
jgi:hypothetical protein